MQGDISKDQISYITKKDEYIPYAFRERNDYYTTRLFDLLVKSSNWIADGSIQFYVIDVN